MRSSVNTQTSVASFGDISRRRGEISKIAYHVGNIVQPCHPLSVLGTDTREGEDFRSVNRDAYPEVDKSQSLSRVTSHMM